MLWSGVSHLVLNQATLPGSIVVRAQYVRPAPPDSHEDPGYYRELHLFSWEGVPQFGLREPVCTGTVSPDGSYLAWEEGEEFLGKAHVVTAWPSVVIADAETCEPLFRVRSAYRTKPESTDRQG